MMDNLARIRQWASDNLTKSQAGRLCGMLSDVSRENNMLKELLSESAQTKERLYAELNHYKGVVRARYVSPVVELVQESAKLKAENARLRELVRDYYEAPCVECHPWDEGWHGCKHCDGGDCTLATRAIELGIEVTS